MKHLARYLLPAVLALAGACAAAADTVQGFEPESMERILAKREGKPFVLVLWSLDCVYCKASLRTLSQEGKRRRIDIVTVATDPVGDPETLAQIRQRLAQAGVRGEAWAFGDAPPEQLRYAIDPAWYGELPRSYWFDGRGGRLAHSGIISREMAAKLLPLR